MTININPGRTLVLATDGACLFNPGPGGWAVIINEVDSGDAVVSRAALAGRADGDTTNNQMELQAAIEALRYSEGSGLPVTIVTDSEYVRQGITSWLPTWKANGWRKSDRKPVKNREQWETLDRLNETQEVTWTWVRAHNGHDMNEAADRLANDAAWGLCESHRGSLPDLYPELFSGPLSLAA